MSRGTKKTVIERQIATYNGFQNEIAKADRRGEFRRAPLTVAEQIAFSIERAREDRRYAEREKAIAEFKKTQPVFGKLSGLSETEIAEISAIRQKWTADFKRFVANLA